MFYGRVFCHVLRFVVFPWYVISSILDTCCRKSGFLIHIKDLFSALRFTFCIYCYVPALSYVTGFPFTLLCYVYHMCPVINGISGLGTFIVIITSFR